MRLESAYHRSAHHWDQSIIFIETHRKVDQHQIHVAKLQFLQRLVYRSRRFSIGMGVAPNLAGYENVFPFHLKQHLRGSNQRHHKSMPYLAIAKDFLEDLSDFVLVLVQGGAVNVTVSNLQRHSDSLSDFARFAQPSAQTQLRHLMARIQGQ